MIICRARKVHAHGRGRTKGDTLGRGSDHPNSLFLRETGSCRTMHRWGGELDKTSAKTRFNTKERLNIEWKDKK